MTSTWLPVSFTVSTVSTLSCVVVVLKLPASPTPSANRGDYISVVLPVINTLVWSDLKQVRIQDLVSALCAFVQNFGPQLPSTKSEILIPRFIRSPMQSTLLSLMR